MRTVSMENRGWLIAAMVAVLLALGLYMAGRWQERSAAVSAREALDEQIATLTTDRDRVRTELAASQDLTALLRARSLLFETALDLERRNFGTANTRLDEAARQLASVRSSGERPEIERLRAEMTGMDLRVASNLAAQRDAVLGMAARLDTIISGTPAMGGNP